MKTKLLLLTALSTLTLIGNASAELARKPTPEIQLGGIKPEDKSAIPTSAPFAPLFVVTCPDKFIVNFDPNTNNAFCQRAITYHASLKCPSGYPKHVYFEADEVSNLNDRDFCLASDANLKPRTSADWGKRRISGRYIDVPQNGVANGQSFLEEYADAKSNDGWQIEPPSTNGEPRTRIARFYRTLNLYAKPGYRANP